MDKRRKRDTKKEFNKKTRPATKSSKPPANTGEGSYNIISVKGAFCTLRTRMKPWWPKK